MSSRRQTAQSSPTCVSAEHEPFQLGRSSRVPSWAAARPPLACSVIRPGPMQPLPYTPHLHCGHPGWLFCLSLFPIQLGQSYPPPSPHFPHLSAQSPSSKQLSAWHLDMLTSPVPAGEGAGIERGGVPRVRAGWQWDPASGLASFKVGALPFTTLGFMGIHWQGHWSPASGQGSVPGW